jgi:DNA-binding transcriptional LysR family regulator
VLREFKESFPEHTIALQTGDTPELIGSLLEHRIDLAVGLEAEKEPQLDFFPLFEDELQFLVCPQHAWARTGHAERAEISREHHILYNKRSVTFRLIENYFRHEEMVLNSVIEVGSMEATKELVKLGLGVSILAPWIARKEIEEGSLVALPLGKRKLKRRWGMLLLKNQRLTLAQETFIGLCKTVSENFRS